MKWEIVERAGMTIAFAVVMFLAAVCGIVVLTVVSNRCHAQADNYAVAIMDSYMSGTNDSVAEMNKLAGFVTNQQRFGGSRGFDPTVYSAEALGLALANYRNFPGGFGALSDANFIAELSSLTGINIAAIAGWLRYWETQYYGVLAKGLTFGDAFGSLLENPNANPTTQARTREINNGVKCLALGLWAPGVPIGQLQNCTNP